MRISLCLGLLVMPSVLVVADPARVVAAESQTAADTRNDPAEGLSSATRDDASTTAAESPSNQPQSANTASPVASAENRLESAFRGMRDAESLISKRQLGQSTRDLQQQVVRDLEALIEQAKRQQSSSSVSSQSSSPLPDQRQRQSDAQRLEQQDPNRQADDTPGKQRKQDDVAANSSEADETSEDVAARFQIRGQLVNEVWGHLPPSLRDRLRSDYSSQPLPQYEELIRRYFQSLAEENRSDNNRPRRRK